jgi:hypothetical protein
MSLIVSILDKAENFNEVCRTYPDYVEYDKLKNTVQLFNAVLPPLLVIANTLESRWAQEANIVLGNFIDMFPMLYSGASRPTAIIDASFELIQKELKTYYKILMEYTNDSSMLRQFTKTLEHHRTAPQRWCIINDRKYVPVLNLQNDVLFEDWVPE